MNTAIEPKIGPSSMMTCGVPVGEDANTMAPVNSVV